MRISKWRVKLKERVELRATKIKSYKEYIWRASGIEESQSKENRSRWRMSRKGGKSRKQSIWNEKFVIIKVQFRTYGWCWHEPTASAIMECISSKANQTKGKTPPPIEQRMFGTNWRVSIQFFPHFILSFFLWCVHFHVTSSFARVLTQFSDCCKLESEKFDSKR